MYWKKHLLKKHKKCYFSARSITMYVSIEALCLMVCKSFLQVSVKYVLKCNNTGLYMSKRSRPESNVSINSSAETPISWWRHQMETFSALLVLCEGNSPVTGEFHSQRPVTRSFDVSFICVWINDWVNNQDAGDLRHNPTHYDVIVMFQDN